MYPILATMCLISGHGQN